MLIAIVAFNTEAELASIILCNGNLEQI